MRIARLSIPRVRLAFLPLAAALASCRALPQTSSTSTGALVREALAAQVVAWNRGDIRGFMAGYYNSESTSFLSGTRLTRGFQPVLDGYLRRYPTGKQGTLAFDIVEVVPISEDAAYVIGKYRLSGDVLQSGMFTLILRRFDGRFVIVHDHTAADPDPAPAKPN